MRLVTESAKFSDNARRDVSEILGDGNIEDDIAVLEKAVGDVQASKGFPETKRKDYLAKIEAIRAPAEKLARVLHQLIAPAQSNDAGKLQLKLNVEEALRTNLPTKREKDWAGQDWSVIEHIHDVVETLAEAAGKAKLEFPQEESKPTGKLSEYTIAWAAAQVLRKHELDITATDSKPDSDSGKFSFLIHVCLVELNYTEDQAFDKAKYLAEKFISEDAIERVKRGNFDEIVVPDLG